jgi:hypothetical protein
MESTYYNLLAPASYGGLDTFKPKGYTKKQVRELLQSQDTYTLHKPTRRRFLRRRVVVYGIDHQWQADLVDLAKLSSYNKGFKYLLTCIDVLSIGRSIDRQDGEDFKRCVSGHFQIGAAFDTFTDRQRNCIYQPSISNVSQRTRHTLLYHLQRGDQSQYR